MGRTASSPLSTDLTASLEPSDLEFLAVCDEVRIGRIRATPGLTELTGLMMGTVHYADKSTTCRCVHLRLYKFADNAYTLCAEHGLREIGYLRREFSQNGRKA